MYPSAEVGQKTSSSKEDNNIEPKLKKGRDRKFRIIPLLKEDIYNEEIPLEDYWVLNVSSSNIIGEVLKLLPSMPNSSAHLKRIKNGCILIQPSSIPLAENFISNLSIQLDTELSVSLVSVPKVKPYTRRQFEWAKQRWPTGFHPNSEIESLLDGSFFDEAESRKIFHFFLEAEKAGHGGSGCVIVNVNGEIVARSGKRPVLLGHAVMCAVSDLCESHRIEKSDVLQYLGTGFDVFLTEEPCAMCAMALVHFRVGRVFFNKKKSKGGALESSWRIHEERRLNHQYKVFRIEEVL